MTALEMSALRAAAELSLGDARGEAGFGYLAADCAARFWARLARPQRASGDWSIKLPSDICACGLCGILREFLEDKASAPSNGRSLKTADSTSTLRSTLPNCPSPT